MYKTGSAVLVSKNFDLLLILGSCKGKFEEFVVHISLTFFFTSVTVSKASTSINNWLSKSMSLILIYPEIITLIPYFKAFLKMSLSVKSSLGFNFASLFQTPFPKYICIHALGIFFSSEILVLMAEIDSS